MAAARAAGDREAELQGVNWRVADLFELGELDALCTRRSPSTSAWPPSCGCPPTTGTSRCGGRRSRCSADRLDEAERLSEEGERIGRSAQDDNAELLFEVQRNGIDGAAGRMADEEYEPRCEGAPSTRPPAAPGAPSCWSRTLRARRTRTARRARSPREVAALAAAPLDANWLYTATSLGVLGRAPRRRARRPPSCTRGSAPYGHRDRDGGARGRLRRVGVARARAAGRDARRPSGRDRAPRGGRAAQRRARRRGVRRGGARRRSPGVRGSTAAATARARRPALARCATQDSRWPHGGLAGRRDRGRTPTEGAASMAVRSTLRPVSTASTSLGARLERRAHQARAPRRTNPRAGSGTA